MSCRLLSVMLLVVGFSGAARAQSDDDETVLFNGKDLSGWIGRDDLWSVADGSIVGRTTESDPIEANTFLIWTKEKPGNFELEATFKIEGGNSGIQYRSEVLDKEGFVVGGYQADIDATNKFAGIVYGEKTGRGILAQRGEKAVFGPDGEKQTEQFAESDALAASIHPGEWNQYRIVADGSHITQYINGTKVSELIDNSEKAADSGVIALQLHRGPAMTVSFKDLVLRSLD